MAQTCLQIIQTACRRIGILAPNAVVGSTDPQIIQLLAISEEEGQEQADRYQWESLQQEATFTTVATQVQTTLAAITTGFNYIVNDTIWNRSLRRPVYGPKSQQDWQQDKALQLNGPFNAFRIINEVINFYPDPVAGQSCYFEYISENWVTTGVTSSPVWVTDADTPKIDDQILILGTIWRWKQAKGRAYGEDLETAERSINRYTGAAPGRRLLILGGGSYSTTNNIPEGNWNQ